MSTDRDATRIVRSWLHEDWHEDATRVLGAVLDELDTTPQRRQMWLARRLEMNRFLGLGLAAAAVVVAAFIGVQLFGGANVGGPGPTETPTPTPEVTASPSPTAAAFPAAGPMAIGRHSMTLSGVQLTFEITTGGWVSNGTFAIDKGQYAGGGEAAPDSAGFIFWTSAPDNVYADPCAQTPLSPPVGPSAAELAAAVSTVPGTELVSGPSEVTVGGYPAQHVTISVPEDVGCAPDEFHLWGFATTDPGNSRYATELNSTINTWIIDVDGTLVWIDGETYAYSGPEAEQELEQIVDSIQFE